MPGLARRITLLSRQEIRQLLRAARTVSKQQGLDIRRATTLYEFGRILIIIPKRVGNAPIRNRIRRRLKSIFYEHKLYEHKLDLVVFVTPAAASLNFYQLQELLTKAVKEGT